MFISYRKKIYPALLSIMLLIIAFMGFDVSVDASKSSIPKYSGSATVAINNNVPEFGKTELVTTSFEKYGNLDKYGRCTVATACVGTDIMPTEDRGSIGSVKPTGWNQNKYPGIVNSEPPYLYNRCHIIGYQLTGENANEKNLITGTRYMNVEGMLPYENIVADYVKTTGNHVMYRVTPVFDGNNLLCSGVQMEAYSVEDSGKGVSFNVFCFNVQPGVIINYEDGSNKLDEGFVITGGTGGEEVTRSVPTTDTTVQSTKSSSYVANKNTKKFHIPSCGSVSDMKEKNKLYYDGTREELINQGYEPCKRCNP